MAEIMLALKIIFALAMLAAVAACIAAVAGIVRCARRGIDPPELRLPWQRRRDE